MAKEADAFAADVAGDTDTAVAKLKEAVAIEDSMVRRSCGLVCIEVRFSSDGLRSSVGTLGGVGTTI